MSGEQIGI